MVTLFSCEYCESIYKNYFEEHLSTAASNIHKVAFSSPLVQAMNIFSVYDYEKTFQTLNAYTHFLYS